jgi:hypothetical protein
LDEEVTIRGFVESVTVANMTDKLDWAFAHGEGKCDLIYAEEQYASPLFFSDEGKM